MKIAIVGSGVSGLVAAFHLQRHHEITVFEANDYVGGHVNTVDVQVDDRDYAIDTGFIVYNDWTYPKFIELLEQLRVPSRPTEMSFSVADPVSRLEYNGHSLNTLFAQRRNLLKPSFHRMVRDVLRFNRQAGRAADDFDDGVTVEEFLTRHGYSQEFAQWYLLPMGAAIWSCPTGQFGRFPIRFIAEFYRNHGLLNIRNRPTWRVVEGGSRRYVSRLTAGFEDRIRVNAPVVSVRRTEKEVEVFADGQWHQYEHVVFACHADQALRILGDSATSVERELLSAFPYSRNVAILHTDRSLLPRSRRAWASWNYRLREDAAAPASVTYNMNILQGIRSETVFCVTLNGESEIESNRIIQRFVYQHPVFTTDRTAAQSRHRELLASNRASFCGAYWRNGFHEDGVVSAQAVVDAIDAMEHRNFSGPDSGRTTDAMELPR